MEKKQTRSTAKTPAKSATLRKVTVRDLGPRKAEQIKGGPESSRQRCY
jgi:hypothetical protein